MGEQINRHGRRFLSVVFGLAMPAERESLAREDSELQQLSHEPTASGSRPSMRSVSVAREGYPDSASDSDSHPTPPFPRRRGEGVSFFAPTILAILLSVSTVHPELYSRPLADLGVSGRSYWSMILPYVLPSVVGSGNMMGLAMYMMSLLPAHHPFKLKYLRVLSVWAGTAASMALATSLGKLFSEVQFPIIFWPWRSIFPLFWSPTSILIRIFVLATMSTLTMAPALVAIYTNTAAPIVTTMVALTRFVFGISAIVFAYVGSLVSDAVMLKWAPEIVDQSDRGLLGLKTAEGAAALWNLAASTDTVGTARLPSDPDVLGSFGYASARTGISLFLMGVVFLVTCGIAKVASNGRDWQGTLLAILSCDAFADVCEKHDGDEHNAEELQRRDGMTHQSAGTSSGAVALPSEEHFRRRASSTS